MKLVIAIAAALFAASMSFATTIHVPADQPTIQAGVNAASTGDTVLVAPGTYTGHTTIDGKTVCLMSSDGAAFTTLIPSSPSSGVVTMTATSEVFPALIGFTITQVGDGAPAVRVALEARATIAYNVFHDNLPSRNTGTVVVSCDGEYAEVRRNVFFRNGGISCIGLSGDSALIINNTFDDNARGFYSVGARAPVALNNVVTNSDQYGIFGPFALEDYNNLWNNTPNRAEGALGGHDISALPQFQDQPANDYHLLHSSPCIDAGNPDPSYNDPDGTRSDIGAYPFFQGPRAADIDFGESSATHLTNHSPTISWRYLDEVESIQESLTVEIGADTDWNLAECWSLGPIPSGDTFAVYSGTPLSDGLTYFGRVRLCNTSNCGAWIPFTFRMNSLPVVPMRLSPANGGLASPSPTLWLHNATDAEGDALTYDFAGFHDTDCVSGTAIELNNIPSGPDSTGGQITTPLAENCRYWWMARAFDGYEYGEWSPYATFWVNGIEEPPSAPTMQFPPDPGGLPVFDMRPTFRWLHSFDPDPHDTVRYTIELSLNSIFQGAVQYDAATLDSMELPDSLEFATRYWWRVKATDRTGLWTQSVPSRSFWTWALGDLNHDHTCDIADLSRIVDFLFFGAEISPLFVGDINGSCNVDISDLTRMIDYLFFDGPAPKVGC